MPLTAHQPRHVTHPWVVEGQRRVRFGIGNGPRNDWAAIGEFVSMVEALGFDSFWLSDHPMLYADCWTTLAALAMTTRTLRLGTLVSCVFYRNPVLLARVAADVDRVSNGRIVLGIGGGDFEFEFAQMGLPFPPVGRRLAAVADALQIVVPLLGGETVTYQGEHFQVAGAALRPRPVQQPHLPILIAGGGERVTLRLVAEYADMSNFGATAITGGAYTVDDVRRKLDVLRRHAEAFGRPADSIQLSYIYNPTVLAKTPAALQAKLDRLPQWLIDVAQGTMLAATPADAIGHLRNLIAAGIQYFTLFVYGDDVETVRLLAEQVLPEVSTG